jgi:xanthine dehydrogenase accessory factor
MTGANPTDSELALLLDAADRAGVVQLATLVAAPPGHDAVVGGIVLLHADGRIEGELGDPGLTARIAAELEYSRWPGPCLRTVPYGGGEYRLFWDALGHDRFRTVILGGGHISRPLAAMLALVGYEVTVVDDRPDFADRRHFPPGSEVVCNGFRAFMDTFTADAATAVVIVTRGHRHDLECLRAVLGQPAAYIGMIGSRRKVAAVFALLREEGADERLLARVRAPIGLDIGAEGPAEIALSVAAEIVAVLRGADARPLSERREGDG